MATIRLSGQLMSLTQDRVQASRNPTVLYGINKQNFVLLYDCTAGRKDWKTPCNNLHLTVYLTAITEPLERTPMILTFR